jgi:hypothetical protein
VAANITADIKAKHKGKRIIVGIDMCQRLSGLALKLAAFEKLLTDYSHSFNEEWTGVVLVQRYVSKYYEQRLITSTFFVFWFFFIVIVTKTKKRVAVMMLLLLLLLFVIFQN